MLLPYSIYVNVLQKAIIIPKVPTGKKKGFLRNMRFSVRFTHSCCVFVEHFYMKVVVLVLMKGTVQYFCPHLVQGNRQND